MPRILTQNLIPGMVVAEDVYTYNNQLVLLKDTELTDKSITKLEFYSIISVRVREDSAAASSPEDLPQDEMTYSQRIKASPEYKEFKQNFEKSIDEFKGQVNTLLTTSKGSKVDTDSLLMDTNNILRRTPSGLKIFDMLHNMRMYDDPTFAHCMNVALICHVFGQWLNMPDRDVDTLTVAGLLHDVGKIGVPDSVINKPGRLDDDEFHSIQSHTIIGSEILQNISRFPDLSVGARSHHERYDGKGYPDHLAGEAIPRPARIIAVADTYDAMTSSRSYRKGLPQDVARSEIEKGKGTQFDPHFADLMLQLIDEDKDFIMRDEGN